MNRYALSAVLFITSFLVSSSLVAQVPQGIPYQAMIRGNDGAALVNANVTVRFTLHQNTTTGPIEYQETQVLTTNAHGLINTQFGNGTPSLGTFSGINWGEGSKHMQVECDLGNGLVDPKAVCLLAKAIGGTKQFIIEQESYQGIAPLECARINLERIKTWGLV